MRNLFAVLFMIGAYLAGLSYAQVCVSPMGVSLAGHDAANSLCAAPIHTGEAEVVLVAEKSCGECVDILLSDEESSSSASASASRTLVPMPALLAVIWQVAQLPSFEAVRAEYASPLPVLEQGHLNPLGTVVLRM